LEAPLLGMAKSIYYFVWSAVAIQKEYFLALLPQQKHEGQRIWNVPFSPN